MYTQAKTSTPTTFFDIADLTLADDQADFAAPNRERMALVFSCILTLPSGEEELLSAAYDEDNASSVKYAALLWL